MYTVLHRGTVSSSTRHHCAQLYQLSLPAYSQSTLRETINAQHIMCITLHNRVYIPIMSQGFICPMALMDGYMKFN